MPSLAFNAVYLNGCIQIIDISMLSPDAVPIETAPDQVIQELKKLGYDIERPILYLDVYNRWDGMKVLNGSFDEYLEINCPTWERAIAVLLKHQILAMPKRGDDKWDIPHQPWSGINGGTPLVIDPSKLLDGGTKH